MCKYEGKVKFNCNEIEKIEYIQEPRFHIKYEEKYCLPINPQPNSILCLSAGLGKGKTKVLIDFMKEQINKNSEIKILILSPRQVFASSLLDRLRNEGLDFTCYLDVKPIRYDSQTKFIVQMESLQHIKIKYDIIIIDEVESCLAQFESEETMKSNLKQCAEIFRKLIQDSSYVVCGDAFLSTKTTNVLSKISDKQMCLIKNTSSLVARKAIEYENIESLTQSLLNDLNKGKKIFFVSASREKVECLERIILKTLPMIKFKIYHSHSKEKIKNVNDDWKDTNLVMVSPSVTVGVNYDIEDFDILYMYGVSVSCCVRDLFQSSMRVRHLNDNLMKFCICKSFLSKNRDENQFSLKNIADSMQIDKKIYRDFQNKHLNQPDSNNSNQWEELPDWLFLNKVYTIREQNLSKRFYKNVFYYYLKFCNYSYNMDEGLNLVTNIFFGDFTKTIKYKEVKEITDEQEAMKVASLLQSGEKDFGLYLGMLKYNFNNFFNVSIIRDEKIDDIFKDYINPKCRKKFYNVKKEKHNLNGIDFSDYLRNIFLENSSKDAIRTLKIKEINKILDLKNSCDKKLYNIEETNSIIDKIYPRYDELSNVFNIKEQKLNENIDKSKEKRERVKYLLDQIYFKWNGSSLICHSKQKMKKRERIYTHWFEKKICGYIYEEEFDEYKIIINSHMRDLLKLNQGQKNYNISFNL
jgi:hypothetical protein